MIELNNYEVWFVTGSQELYGEATLKKVAEDSQKIASGMNQSGKLPVRVVFKPVVTSPEAISALCKEANNAQNCVGLITWMHTFSPAKMWIAGLKALQKPLLHLHTQFNRDLPWSSIDMDFMNLNQSAHGDREFGFIGSRMRLDRKVVVGFWQDEDVLSNICHLDACRLLLGTTSRGAESPASATICAKWPSPKATRWKPRSSSGIRSMAMALATWSRLS